VQFTASASLREKLGRLQALMLSSVPDGGLATIVEAAVTEKLERLEARRFANTRKPRKTLAESDTAASSLRHIPAAVRRIVRQRDGDRCRYVDAQGRRCTARERLEFHHRHPYGYGGNRAPDNIKLLCHAHNAYVAEVDYGARPRETPSTGVRAAAP
jgi:5-methylcytosine-specific restriction endonuclease McrA